VFVVQDSYFEQRMARYLAGFLENELFRPPVAGDLAVRTGGSVHSFPATSTTLPLGFETKKILQTEKEREKERFFFSFVGGLKIIKLDEWINLELCSWGDRIRVYRTFSSLLLHFFFFFFFVETLLLH
jgi:hypothetical protein